MILALTLTDEEKANILKYWPDSDSFIIWQREVLAAEIERRAAVVGQQQASEVVRQYVADAKVEFPTIFEPVAEPVSDLIEEQVDLVEEVESPDV